MRLLEALDRRALDRPPVWLMRQAGRYLPEYLELRSRHGFDKAMRTPALAAEITLQPLRRFPLDAAIVFADIMTLVSAMGVTVSFDPGPKLTPLSLSQVFRLDDFDLDQSGHVAETIRLVRDDLDPQVAVVGFAGGPTTVLAYLLEGGGSQHFATFRGAIHADDPTDALATLARATRIYLQAQIDAGADVIQLFDTWAGLLSREQYLRWALPAARASLAGLEAPTVYFAPNATHLLDLIHGVGATAYGVDWRLPLGEAWRRLGEGEVIQGNLDPALLLAGPEAVRRGTIEVLEEAGRRPGHVFNLGHGVIPGTSVESVRAMVETVHSHERVVVG